MSLVLRPVLLCGGSGSRLWPLSRRDRPKPFLSFDDGPSLLSRALARAEGLGGTAPRILGSTTHRFLIAETVRALGVDGASIVLEPVARGTAAAVATAALLEADPDTVLVILPADHHIGDEIAMQNALRTAARVAEDGFIAVLGVRPRHPATGYGWILPGTPLDHGLAHRVDTFHEKPDRVTAQRHLDAGALWNAGVFVSRAGTLIQALERHVPELLSVVRHAVEDASNDLDFLRLGEAFSDAPVRPFDRAVLEHTDRAAVVPVDADWHDVGTWNALREVLPRDAEDNVTRGPVRLEDCEGCIIHSVDGPRVVGLGLRDLVVATTADAVLVMPRARAEHVRALVDRLRDDASTLADEGTTVHRPWGTWTRLYAAEGLLVKTIRVAPGHRLSLQRHRARDEHWVVVHGTAEVSIDETSHTVHANGSVHVPAGATHRLANPGPSWLELVEVQTGERLDEDDIERLHDDYARKASDTPR